MADGSQHPGIGHNSGVVWAPQSGPQLDAIVATWCAELFYGGAAGGGKSDFLLGDFLQDVPTYGSAWRGVIFRRSYPELEELISRSREMYPSTGARYREDSKTWTWPNGATLKMRYLERNADALRYHGHQYTWIGWDELTQWHSLWPYRYLRSRLRSAHHVPTKRIRAAANPGGASHIEVKSYFVDVAPAGVPYLDAETGIERMFIPAKLNDNRILVDNDPTYRGRLRALGGNLARAMEDGDWSIIEGAFFDNWSQARNVVQPFKVPSGWVRFVSLDWGSAKPFSVGWWAVCDDPFEATNANGDPITIPRGAMVRYREWYGSTGEPNVGLKLTAEKVSEGVRARELIRAERRDERTGQLVPAVYEAIAYRVADPSIAKMDGGPSIKERMSPVTEWRMADNARVAQGGESRGAMGGWDQMRSRINGDLELDDQGGLVRDDGAMLLVFTTCKDFLRTVPVLQHDPSRAEDIDTDGEDHAADEARYACMSRPYAKPRPPAKPAEPRGVSNMTFDEMMKLQERIERNRMIG